MSVRRAYASRASFLGLLITETRDKIILHQWTCLINSNDRISGMPWKLDY